MMAICSQLCKHNQSYRKHCDYSFLLNHFAYFLALKLDYSRLIKYNDPKSPSIRQYFMYFSYSVIHDAFVKIYTKSD
jgi:hypothetical protein